MKTENDLKLWKIYRATDLEGNAKVLPKKRLERTYEIIQLIVGYPAIMVDDVAQGTLLTSIVNDFILTDDTLTLYTLNTVYYFEHI